MGAEEIGGRGLRKRAAVNYAELTSVLPSMKDQVLRVFESLEAPEEGTDLFTLVNGVHTLSEEKGEGPLLPFSTVQRSVGSLLRQGLLRRRLARIPPVGTATEGSANGGPSVALLPQGSILRTSS